MSMEKQMEVLLERLLLARISLCAERVVFGAVPRSGDCRFTCPGLRGNCVPSRRRRSTTTFPCPGR